MRLGAVPREVRLHLPDLLELTRDARCRPAASTSKPSTWRSSTRTDAERSRDEVNARMPGVARAPDDGAAGSGSTFVVLERFHLAIATVTIIASTVFLLALTIMLVDERRETVGVLRLIGLPARRILVQVLLEGLLIATAGALFGLVLALGSEGIYQPLLPVALRHRAGLRAGDARGRRRLRGHRGPARRGGDRRGSWALLRRSGLRLARR